MTPDFSSLAGFGRALRDVPGPDPGARAQAVARDAQLTKPPGALGRLEDLAFWYCSWRGAHAVVEHPEVLVFAGNHGVVAQGVSAFPADVTAQMVANFEAGGAAVNQLARSVGARLGVHALSLDRPTQDIMFGPAMTEAECLDALQSGWDAVGDATDLLVVGEMGIGNTTSAAAISLALFGGNAQDWTGAGTGVTGAALAHKADVVARAVAANAQTGEDGLRILCRLGGREIAAMAGAIARARASRIPVLLDGYICTAAAACLAQGNPGVLDHCQSGHVSAETAHARVLQHLGLSPILDLEMRLGEASGATLAIAVLRAALACHRGMATFAEAGVSEEG